MASVAERCNSVVVGFQAATFAISKLVGVRCHNRTVLIPAMLAGKIPASNQ